MPKKQQTSFNVILDPRSRSMLDELAAARHFSRGAMIRELILNAFNFRRQSPICCPDGQRCFVPQMHTHPAPGTIPPVENP